MASSLFFMSTDQTHVPKPVQQLSRNTYVGSGTEIRPEPVKTRGRKPKSTQNQKKNPQRGMGVEKLERFLRMEEKGLLENSNPNPNPNTQFPLPEPVVVGSFPVLHGVPSYGGPATGGRFGGLCCAGSGSGHHQIPGDPNPQSNRVSFSERLAFVETSNELSSIPNFSQIYGATDRCDPCFKKKRCHGEGIRSNGGGSSKYTMISSMNGYDSPTFDQEIGSNSSFVYDHFSGYLARTRLATSSLNCSGQILNEGSMEMMGSYMKGNPRNGGVGMQNIIKEYEFFPGKSENFLGKYGQEVEISSVVSASNCNTNAAALDLSLKL